MAGIGQYLKDTRSELRHVAWPTRMQTVIYTVLVVLLSIGVSLYLGLFDYIFTGTLTRFLSALPSAPIELTETPPLDSPLLEISTSSDPAPQTGGGDTGPFAQ